MKKEFLTKEDRAMLGLLMDEKQARFGFLTKEDQAKLESLPEEERVRVEGALESQASLERDFLVLLGIPSDAEAIRYGVSSFKDGDPISTLLLYSEFYPSIAPYSEEDQAMADSLPSVVEAARKIEADPVALAKAFPFPDLEPPMRLSECLGMMWNRVTSPCAFREALSKVMKEDAPERKDLPGAAPDWVVRRTASYRVQALPRSPSNFPKIGS